MVNKVNNVSRGILLLAFLLSVAQAGQVVTVNGKTRKALVVVWDGCRGDVADIDSLTPHLHQLAQGGASSFAAFGGGTEGTDTTAMTVTNPGFSTIFTGVFAQKHGVFSNNEPAPNWALYPSIFKRLKDAMGMQFQTAALFGKQKIDSMVALEGYPDWHYGTNGAEDIYHAEVTNHLQTSDVDFFFYSSLNPDGVGHAYGYSPANYYYTNNIFQLDAKLGDCLAAIQRRSAFANEDWLVIVTSDHGGYKYMHGGHRGDEKGILFVVRGPGIPAGVRVVRNGPSNADVLATVFRHFNLPPPAGLDTQTFGFDGEPPSRFGAVGVRSNDVYRMTIRWQAPIGDWSMTLLRGGETVATLIPAEGQYVFIPSATGLTNYTLLATNHTQVVTWPFTAQVPVFPESLYTGLLVYLPLNGSVTNRAPNGIPVTVMNGTPVFVSSPIGQAAHFSSYGWYLDAGYPSSVQYGSFTVSLWIQMSDVVGSTASYLGTQNSADFSSLGFSFTQSYPPRCLNWSVEDVTWPACDQIDNWYAQDTWMYVTAVFDRVHDVVWLYKNGVKIGQKTFNKNGLASPELNSFNFQNNPLLFGTSGTTSYRGSSYQDEIMLWDRALTEDEVTGLHAYQGIPHSQGMAVEVPYFFLEPYTADVSQCSAVAQQTAVNGYTFYACYAFGFDPLDPLARVTTLISIDGEGRPVIDWTPKGREIFDSHYHVEGKIDLSDPAWEPQTPGQHFFHVILNPSL